jgi:tetratricopeptide (TPR) repeat protein
MAAGLARPPGAGGSASAAGPRRGRPAVALAAVACVALAVLFAGPWLSERHVEHAAESWRADPDGAFSSLDRAATLNPLSSAPDVVAATIALRLGREADAERRFRAVLDEDPENAYAAFEIGLVAAADGRRAEAVGFLRRALALNPNDALVAAVLQRVRSGARIDPAAVNARIVRDARSTAQRPRGRGK